MADRKQLPGSAELEISLFGPGYGECIIVHTGNGEWLIIDSCIDNQGAPAAIGYLKSIGVDPTAQVKWILATHWHDDHIRGLSRLLEACPNAAFACSTALKANEFLKLAAVMSSGAMMAAGTGVDEFSKIFRILQQRVPPQTPSWAIEGRLLWRRSSGHRFELHALSPSDANVTLALNRIGRLFPKLGAPKNRIPSLTPNQASVALWLCLGDHRILLGADLEETGEAGRGWTAVVKCATRPAGKAFAFKIPHHGSVTAELKEIWTDLLDSQPLGILTPFLKGDVRLPTDSDRKRIRRQTNSAYITAPLRPLHVMKRPTMVSKMISQTVKRINPVFISPGQIRLRCDVNDRSPDIWRVDLFNGASRL